MTTTARRAGLLAASLLTLGCSDDLSRPRGIEGTYFLALAGDRTVPADVFDGTYTDEEGVEHRITLRANTGRITLVADGTRYFQLVDLSATVDGSPSVVSDVEDQGACTRSGATLSCQSDVTENVSFTAQISNDALTITQDLSGEGAPLAYVYGR